MITISFCLYFISVLYQKSDLITKEIVPPPPPASPLPIIAEVHTHAPSKGMATVRWGNKVLLLGGMNEREEELDDVISYDIESGETTRLPRMKEKRGGCCAVNTPTVDTSSACSSDTSTDTLVALASLRNSTQLKDTISTATRGKICLPREKPENSAKRSFLQ
jgi:hypothetical protein